MPKSRSEKYRLQRKIGNQLHLADRRRLLAKDPEERYPSAEAVVEALGAVQDRPELAKLPV